MSVETMAVAGRTSHSRSEARDGTVTSPAVRANHRRRQPGIHIGLVVLVAVSLAPYVFMLVTAGKTNEQYYKSFWAPALPFHWENFSVAWHQISPYMIASIVVSAASLVGIIIVSLVAGFALARFHFPARNMLFGMVAALMMVPSIASLIPLFVMMKDFHLLNTYAVMILPHIATGSILATILMRTFIEGIPQTLFEAAQIDGASVLRQFFSIMMPLSLPVIGTVAIVTVQGVWNDFFWPLLTITDNNLKTASVGLLFFQGQSATQFGSMFAGYLLASLPLLLLFIFFSKYFLAGIQGGIPGSH